MDLDGTISDPKSGLFASFRASLQKVGHAWPDERPLDWIIGPPLRQSFMTVLGDETLAAAALAHYRVVYGGGAMFDNVLYPGMVEAITALGASGFRLFVATSKLTAFAERIVANFDLAGRFVRVYGSTADGRFENKADIVALCLAEETIDPTRCVMVGDRKHDVLAAAAHAVPCIGVAWGYGGIEELRAAGAASICEAPSGLRDTVEQVLGDCKPSTSA